MTALPDKSEVERFRETNRRMNRRLQMLEGWWQRKVERAEYFRNVYLGFFVRDASKLGINVKSIEEAAYQRGYHDGYDDRRIVPNRRFDGKTVLDNHHAKRERDRILSVLDAHPNQLAWIVAMDIREAKKP